jgi:N-acetylmuramoyl-L-alanine amidase
MAISILQPTADRTFLALDGWREARGELREARVAVMYTVMQRVKLRKWYGTDVMSVLFKKWQYSSLTNPKDPQLTTWPASDDEVWQECLFDAEQVLTSKVPNPAIGADSYFDDSIAPPAWAKPTDLLVTIGRLSFYDLNRDFEAESMGAPALHKAN